MAERNSLYALLINHVIILPPAITYKNLTSRHCCVVYIVTDVFLVTKYIQGIKKQFVATHKQDTPLYEGWNFNSGNYLFTTDTK